MSIEANSRWTPARIVFAVALAFRLVFLLSFQANPLFIPVTGGSDRSLYDQVAAAIAAGQWWPDGVFQYMPLYAWVLALLYTIGGASNFILPALLGAVLDAATCALIVRLAKRIGAATWAAMLAAALYAFYPLAVVYSVLTMPNTMNAFLMICFADRLADALQRESCSWRNGFLLGLVAGLTCLSFAGMLLVTVVSVALLLVDGWRRRRLPLPHVLPLLLLPTFFILPVTLHNRRAEPGFVLITAHGGFNFWMGNHEGATGYPMQIEGFRGDRGSLLYDAIDDAERREGRRLTSAEFSRHWSDRAWTFIRTDPSAWARLLGLKFARFFSATEYDDLRMLPMIRLTGTWLGWPVWPGFGLLAWLGLCGLLAVRGGAAPRAVALTGIFSIVLFFVTARYRLTLAPLLAVFAAGLLSALTNLAASRRLPAFSALLCVALLVWFPMPQTDFRALDHYNAASHLLDRGLAEDALGIIDRGLRIAPESADLHFVRGNALVGLDRLPEAAAAYEKALAANPRHAQARFNRAVVHKLTGDLSRARAEAEAALRDDPRFDMARDFLKQLPP